MQVGAKAEGASFYIVLVETYLLVCFSEEKIREHGYFTRVGRTVYEQSQNTWYPSIRHGECTSACAYAFMGGPQRALIGAYGVGHEKSKIGFHQFYLKRELDQLSDFDSWQFSISSAQFLTGLIVAYTIEMGVDARIVTIANATTPNEITYPTEDQLYKLNVFTKVGFQEWMLEPYGDGIVAASQHSDSSELVEQVTAYCRTRDKAKILMLTSFNPSNAKLSTLQDSAAWSVEMEIDGEILSIKYDKVEFVQQKDNLLFRILLPDGIAEKITIATDLKINMNLPSVMGYHFAEFKLDEMDRKALKLAFKHCP